MNEAVIVSAVRTAVGKAPGGTLRGTRPDELAAAAIAEALKRAPGIDAGEVDDVILGCAMPEAEQGMNVARIASLRAGIPVSASAIIAGGTESMSLVPMGGNKIAPNPTLVDRYPDVYLSTGIVAENHARESGISREEQDAFALRSHQRAVAAIDSGKFAEEIVPIAVRNLVPALVGAGAKGGRGDEAAGNSFDFTVDEGPRRDTSAEAL